MSETINPLVIKGDSKKAWQIARDYLLAESGYACEECGRATRHLEIHHINGCGLDNRRGNLIILCPACHRQRHSQSQWLRQLRGLLRKMYGRT